MDKRVVYLDISREHRSDKSTQGVLLLDGDFFCHTLELPVRENRARLDAIPAGDYAITMQRMSTRPSWGPLPLLLDVPGRAGIFIHPANHPIEILGCIALGMDKGRDCVGRSKYAVDALVREILGHHCTLTIRDCF